MRADYAGQYRKLWNEHWWWRSRERFVVNVIARLKLVAGSRILDIGCGDALFFPSLEQFGEVDGLEADATLLSEASSSRSIQVGSLDRQFQPGPIYDLAVMLDVLEHIENDLEALEAVRLALKPGGRIVITVPAMPLLWSRHDEANRHFRRYEPGLLRQRLVESGFTVESVRFFFGWTVLPLLIRRWLNPAPKPAEERLGCSDSTEYEVAIPPPFINHGLTWLSNVDHWIGSRLRWPLGSSLIAIASVSEGSMRLGTEFDVATSERAGRGPMTKKGRTRFQTGRKSTSEAKTFVVRPASKPV